MKMDTGSLENLTYLYSVGQLYICPEGPLKSGHYELKQKKSHLAVLEPWSIRHDPPNLPLIKCSFIKSYPFLIDSLLYSL